MAKAVIFDLWNTLAYNDVKVNPVLQIERLLGVKIRKYHEAEKSFMVKKYGSIREAAISLCNALNIEPSGGMLDEITRVWEDTVERFTLFPDVIGVLKALKRRCKIGLISNTDCFSVKYIYKNGYARYFDAVVFSCDVGLLKPDRKIFEILLQKLGVKAGETLMVGDNLKDDILPAESLGMRCVLIRRKGPYSLSWIEKGKYKNEISGLEGIWKYIGRA